MSIYSLAYKPLPFFQLGATIAQWAAEEEIFASFPEIIEKDGKTYFYTAFGYCPNDSGVYTAFAYDEMNEEFCMWCSEDPDWDWDETEFTNLDNLNPYRCNTLEDLTKFVKTGE